MFSPISKADKQDKQAQAAEQSRWRTLERALGVRFKERALLRQAVVHRSFLNEHPESGWESYERLEYLGDAFLGWVVADELYRRYRAYSEGALTRARAGLVQGRTLAEVAKSLGLGGYLYLGQGEEATGGRSRRSNLAGALEALLGAVLLDQGAAAARRLVLRWLEGWMDQLAGEDVPRDPKSALQELAQERGLPLPRYDVIREAGPSHAPSFTVQVWLRDRNAGQGTGRRKVEAESNAAAQALKGLESEAGNSL